MFVKYKKKILRVAVVIISVVVLFVMSALPAAAASDGWITAVFNSYDSQIVNFADGSTITGVRDPDGKAMAWQLPGSGPWVGNSVRFFVKANMSVVLNVGDRFNIKSKTIYGWFGGQQNYIIRIRYLLGAEADYNNSTGEPPGTTRWLGVGPWQTYNFQGGASYGLTLPEHEFHLTQYASDAFIAIEFNCSRVSGIENTFSLNHYNFHYGYGNPNSPEYPKYKPFDDDTLTELENAENQVLDGTQGGFDAFQNSVNGVYTLMPKYLKPMVAVVDMLNIYLGIRSLSDIITISLVFGCMAFLLSGSLVAYASRAARSDNAKHGKAGK